MSTFAPTVPLHLPTAPPAPERRPILEVAPARRRRTPKMAHAIVVVAGLIAIALAQLLLSISLGDGAYQAAAIKSEITKIDRTVSAATETAQRLGSATNLIANASAFGMGQVDCTRRLDVGENEMTGICKPATQADVLALGAANIANDLGIQIAGKTSSSTASTNPAAGSGSGAAANTDTPGGDLLAVPDTH